MRIHVAATAELTAARAAEWLRTEIGRAIAQRERCLVALSGGRTPWRMLHELKQLRVHWHGVQLFQVDERVVSASDERRNARQIAELMVGPGLLSAAQFHAMPVEHEPIAAGADDYAAVLAAYGGLPPVLDVVQLGLGADAHTASLLPGDALLEVRDRDVGVSGLYQGVLRMSLTLRALNAARHRLWLVTGADKVTALRQLWDGDVAVPAGRVARAASIVFADAAAAAGLPPALRTPH